MGGARYSPVEMIERLVGFDTTSSKSNLALIDFVERYLRDHGVPARRTANAEGTKANLFATLGPQIAGGVVLSGHTDVVPVAGQPWDSDPFRLSERDGRLYGRGTADMKGFLAVALALVPEFLAAGPKRPIHLALSYDEEVGCLGVSGLIADIAAALPPPAMVIIGEPTSMQIATANKGCYVYRTTVTGKEAHSAQPHLGGNAILAAGDLVHFIGALARERRAAARAADSRFEPPYTTFNVGEIAGGTAHNIIPRTCSITWQFRPLPGEDPRALAARFDRFAETEALPRLREFAPEASIVTEALAAVPPLVPEEDGAAEALVRALTGANTTTVISFATEGGLFQETGFSTVVCGPGAIDQAHQPNEYVARAQVEACEAFLRRLCAWAAGGAQRIT
ncbi:MAG: acetylornithine deacetylase [Kiloniellaceae bacterium]